MKTDKHTGMAPSLPTGDHTAVKLAIGLDILEYLAGCRQPATLSDISERLQVSGTILNRFIASLESKGYVQRTDDGRRYLHSGKLFQLWAEVPAMRRLLRLARPIMQSLSEEILQSCHIAVPSDQDMQVIAEQETLAAFGVTVPLGYRYDIPNSAAGLAYIAFSGKTELAELPMSHPAVSVQAWSSLRASAKIARDMGVVRMENSLLPDVIDLACPVFDNGVFVAALSVPFLQMSSSMDMNGCLSALQAAAEDLNRSLQSDSLVA